VGAETKTPVADCCAEYETIQKRDRDAWVMLTSETIHPNLNGHRVFAQTIVERLTGTRLPLDAFTNSNPAIPCTLALAQAEDKTLKITTVGVAADVAEAAARAAFPKVSVTATARPVPGADIAAFAKQSKTLFAPKGKHLLLIAVPAEPVALDFELYKRHVFTVARYSIPFGYRPNAREVVWVLPSVLNADQSPAVQTRERQMAALGRSYDVGVIARPKGNTQPPADVIAAWLREQAAANQ